LNPLTFTEETAVLPHACQHENPSTVFCHLLFAICHFRRSALMRWDEILEYDGQLLRDFDVAPLGVNPRTLEQILLLAIEISREGREGRKVGAMFVIGDEAATLQCSKNLILDPLGYHPDADKHLGDPNVHETIKELAQLDGAFIVSDAGVVLSACRYMNASSEGIDLPLGLGSRHMAAASITQQTAAVAVVVSESTIVRIFSAGKIVCEIIPELWLLRRYEMNLRRALEEREK
jgi:diadenylate cyclase